MTDISGLILLPRLRVQNANAISGPLSWGFPAPTAFTGFVHALERKFAEQLPKGVAGVGIVCHHFEPQVSQPAGRRHRVFCLSRHPVGKDGGAPALVEEGRAHMEISLLIAVHDDFTDNEGQCLAEDMLQAAYGMRLAGGSPLYREGRRYHSGKAGQQGKDHRHGDQAQAIDLRVDQRHGRGIAREPVPARTSTAAKLTMANASPSAP